MKTFIKHCLLLAMAFGASSGRALPEADVGRRYGELVAPLFPAAHTGYFRGVGDKKVAYAIFQPAVPTKGQIVLLSGFTESYLKYGEVIYDLNQAGYGIFTYDHRGMGLSERLAPDSQIVHVEAFANYVQDLKIFLEQVVRPGIQDADTPVFLLAHSTGGLIATAFLSEGSLFFNKVALSAPLLDMNTGSVPELLAYLIVSFNSWRGGADQYAPGAKPFVPTTATLEGSTTTHSAARFALQKNLWLAMPPTVMSGPSNNWVRTILRATWDQQRLAAPISPPILLLQAGDDTFVDLYGQDEFCQRLKNCTKIHFKGAYHELLFEADTIRIEVMEQILRFFK